jgi:beta-lactamase regulating signal transducer with metallopeptidase domain
MTRSLELLSGFLLNAAWQVAAVVLAALLCSLLLRRTAPRYQHALWVFALVLSIAIPLAGVFVGTRNSASDTRPQMGDISPAPNASTESVIRSASTDADVGDLPSRSRQESVQPQIKSLQIGSPVLVVVSLFYAAFLLFRLARFRRAWRTSKELEQSAYELVLPGQIAEVMTRCQAALKLSRVRLRFSRLASMPVTIGTRNPLIILPEHFADERSDDLLLSVIGHEMAHVSRCDWTLNLVLEILWLPISFHPLAGFIKRQIDRTRELACDDLVTSRLIDRGVYARSLLQVARTFVSRAEQALALGVFDADILEERIMKLATEKARTGVRMARALTVSALVAVCVIGVSISTLSFSLRAGDRSAQSLIAAIGARIENSPQSPAKNDLSNFSRQEGSADKSSSGKMPAAISTDAQARAAAACEIGKSGQVESIPILIAMLSDDRPVQAIRCWDGGRWSPAIQTFKHPTPGEHAAIALASMGSPAFPALANALDDVDPIVRRNAAWAIGELTNMSRGERGGAVPKLVALLDEPDPWLRIAAAQALGELRDPRAFERLIASLGDSEWLVRDRVAWALSEMKDKRAVNSLCTTLLSDANAKVRKTAAWALGEIKSGAALSSLKQALNDPEPGVRATADWAIAEIEDNDG